MKNVVWVVLCSIVAIGTAACGAGGDGAATEDIAPGEYTQQLDPGSRDYIIYYLSDQNTAEVARILVADTSNGTYAAGTEYWNVPNLSALQSATVLTLSAANDGAPWPRGGLPFPWSFHVPHSTWSSTGPSPSGTKLMGTDANGNLAIYDPSGLTQSGSTWGGTMTWWYTGSSAWVSTGGAGSFSMKSLTVPATTWVSIVGTPSQL